MRKDTSLKSLFLSFVAKSIFSTYYSGTQPHTAPRTSKLGQRYFETHKIDRNELQISKTSQKGTETIMAEKLNKEKKSFQPCSQIRALLVNGQMPQTVQPQVWLLIHTQNLEKQVKICCLVRGFSPYKNPTVLVVYYALHQF